jgi:hypothetical protein
LTASNDVNIEESGVGGYPDELWGIRPHILVDGSVLAIKPNNDGSYTIAEPSEYAPEFIAGGSNMIMGGAGNTPSVDAPQVLLPPYNAAPFIARKFLDDDGAIYDRLDKAPTIFDGETAHRYDVREAIPLKFLYEDGSVHNNLTD